MSTQHILTWPRIELACARAKINQIDHYHPKWSFVMWWRGQARPTDIIDVGSHGQWFHEAHPPDFWKESTYEDCIRWSLDIQKATIEVRFYKGDAVYGQPEVEFGGLRYYHWTFKLRPEILASDNPISQYVDFCLRREANIQYQRELAREQDEAVNGIYQTYVKE